jgi:hypothetical protein
MTQMSQLEAAGSYGAMVHVFTDRYWWVIAEEPPGGRDL